MDKFSEFVSKDKVKEQPHITNGAFDCQICDEYVKDAYYNQDANMLYWVCSQGHKSKITEFYK